MSRPLRLLRPSQCLTSDLLATLAPRRPRLALPRPAAAAGFFYTAASPVLLKALPPRPKPPPDSEIEENFLKGSGPGGQKINKTNSAVQLKHLPTGIVVKSQATRSRDQNRKIAREILAQRIDEHFNGDESRTARVAQIKRKKTASADKKKRRKYKKLEEESNETEGLENPSQDEEVRGTKEVEESGHIDDTNKP